MVSLLGAQAAVSLETARLYAELLAENIQRRRVEKELRSSQTSLMLGEQISHTGSWRWELEQIDVYLRRVRPNLGPPEQQRRSPWRSLTLCIRTITPDQYHRHPKRTRRALHAGGVPH